MMMEQMDEPFYFESDSLALASNPDYSCVLRTLALLEAQRIKAIEDIEKLIQLKEAALSKPLEFVRQLNLARRTSHTAAASGTSTTAANDDDGKASQQSTLPLVDAIPSRQRVYMLPDIDWNKYYDSVDLNDLEMIKRQNSQRAHSLRQTRAASQQPSREQHQQEEEEEEEVPSTTIKAKCNSNNSRSDDSKTNYNQSWSVEEQRQLEELLIEFPPEENEAARWRKIAGKLGTRTPLQVQSHCQKYFIKLAKAGLPIPGRMPNLKTYVTKKGNRGSRKSSLMMRGALRAAGGGRAHSMAHQEDAANRKMMVGRGVSLNAISSMWSSFNPPITMSDNENLDEEEEEDSNT
jgi:ZZ-type zinc finger-containing protein 3